MPWWLPMAATAGASIASSVFGKKKRPQAPNAQMQLFDAAIRRAGTRGEGVSNEYLERMRSFDPSKSIREATMAQYNLAMPEIRRAVSDLRGSQVGSGRLNTGMGVSDQDRVLTESFNNLNQSMIARAMEAERMRMQNTSELGAYGQGQQNLYLEGTMGRYMTEEQRRQLEEASRRQMWGGLYGAAISASGQMYAGRKGYS